MLADMATVLINGFLYTAAGNALLFLLVGRRDMGGLVYQLHNSQKSNTFHRITISHALFSNSKAIAVHSNSKNKFENNNIVNSR